MGYEIADGLGVKLAAPDREVWVLVDNHGFASIGALSESDRAVHMACRRLEPSPRTSGALVEPFEVDQLDVVSRLPRPNQVTAEAATREQQQPRRLRKVQKVADVRQPVEVAPVARRCAPLGLTDGRHPP